MLDEGEGEDEADTLNSPAAISRGCFSLMGVFFLFFLSLSFLFFFNYVIRYANNVVSR